MIWLNGTEVLTTPEDLLDARHTALLVIDVQNEIASERGGYAAHGYDIGRIRSIIPATQMLLQAARRLGLLVCYAEFVHRDRRGVTLMDGPNVHLHWQDQWVSDVTDGSWEAATIDELAPAPEDVVIQKSRASAIYNTYLDDILRVRGIQAVALAGCLTDGCVLKTAVDLTQRGYYAVVVRDAVNSFTAEMHDLGLAYVQKKFTTVTADEAARIWSKRGVRVHAGP